MEFVSINSKTKYLAYYKENQKELFINHKNNGVLGRPYFAYVEGEGEGVKYTENFNGYGYVDLGLPSGNLWATRNVGYDDTTPQGLFFCWGCVNGCTNKEVTGKTFYFGTYGSGDPAYSINGEKIYVTDELNQVKPIKYSGETDVNLRLINDACRQNMGGDWELPTEEDFEELINECDISATIAYIKFIKGDKVLEIPRANLLIENKVVTYNDMSLEPDRGDNSLTGGFLWCKNRDDNNKSAKCFYVTATRSGETYGGETYSGDTAIGKIIVADRTLGLNCRGVVRKK